MSYLSDGLPLQRCKIQIPNSDAFQYRQMRVSRVTASMILTLPVRTFSQSPLPRFATPRAGKLPLQSEHCFGPRVLHLSCSRTASTDSTEMQASCSETLMCAHLGAQVVNLLKPNGTYMYHLLQQ
jgi:hypothetical protein